MPSVQPTLQSGTTRHHHYFKIFLLLDFSPSGIGPMPKQQFVGESVVEGVLSMPKELSLDTLIDLLGLLSSFFILFSLF